jgi:hypothetical protein
MAARLFTERNGLLVACGGPHEQTNVCAQSKKTNCRHPATWRDRFRCHGARRYCSLGRDRVAVVGRASGAALTARRFPPPSIMTCVSGEPAPRPQSYLRSERRWRCSQKRAQRRPHAHSSACWGLSDHRDSGSDVNHKEHDSVPSSPLPTTLVRRRIGGLLRRPRSQRTGARVCLFRGRAGVTYNRMGSCFSSP